MMMIERGHFNELFKKLDLMLESLRRVTELLIISGTLYPICTIANCATLNNTIKCHISRELET